MAVESRFVVIRNGVEAKTFMDKKSADEYDKMLDMADNLGQVFSQSSISLSDSLSEELSIYLAQNREEVLIALLAKKPAKIANKKVAEENISEAVAKEKAAPELKVSAKPASKAKKSKAKVVSQKLDEAS
jgi:hypothetical protein